jgi:hypothetical protein
MNSGGSRWAGNGDARPVRQWNGNMKFNHADMRRRNFRMIATW